ncbi:MAG: outer membrane protein transport protein, partial [Moraxella sp.]
TYEEGRDINNMALNYDFINYGAKADINDKVSVGVFFDQPWGADVEFKGTNDFVNGTEQAALAAKAAKAAAAKAAAAAYQADPTNQILDYTAQQAGAAYNIASNIAQHPNEGTNASVDSKNFTGLVGVKFGEKNNWQVYGGPVLQKLEGEVHLRGTAYNSTQGYDGIFAQSNGYGWMAGLAYSKPEIALKAALTYRSDIDHDTVAYESMPATGKSGSYDMTITTPKSVNVDFQTGLNPTTLLTAKLRWVPWSDFSIKPPLYNATTKKAVGADFKPLYPNGLNLIDYSDDGWAAEVGLGKKLSNQWAVSGSVGWDSGAGDPTTTLGPVEGHWNVGLGAKYNVTPEVAVSAGVKYLMFGDAKSKIPNGDLVGDFQNNDAWIYGLRLTYQKK